MWLDAFPVVRDKSQELLNEFLIRLIAYAKGLNAVELLVGSFAYDFGSSELECLDFHLSERIEFELDLSKSEDELWKGFEYKRKKNIRKAIRCNVTIEQMSSQEGIIALRQMQGESSKRIVERGGADIQYQQRVGASDPVLKLVQSDFAKIIGASVMSTIKCRIKPA